ncbi:hypothetical protein G6L37_00555 [Agrobacterium rubi]|nr:hypothetical protein [Agrobacterium rubi]NTF23880.1 hypothetical protein [Agrobacterium rubi]
MNPFAHNPVEIADKALLWISAKFIAFAYRQLAITPVLAIYVPRMTFLMAGSSIFLYNPVAGVALIPGLFLFSFGTFCKLRGDYHNMKKEWNADLYKTYSGKALQEREDKHNRAVVLAFSVTMFVLISTLMGEPQQVVDLPTLPFYVLIGSSILHWMDAADVPEPDDGDLFRRAHTA